MALYNPLTPPNSRQMSGTTTKKLLFLFQPRREICVGIELRKFLVYSKQASRSSGNNNNNNEKGKN